MILVQSGMRLVLAATGILRESVMTQTHEEVRLTELASCAG